MIIQRTNYTWTASAVLGVFRVTSSEIGDDFLKVVHEKTTSCRDGLIFRLYSRGDLQCLEKYYIPSSVCAPQAISVILETIFCIFDYEITKWNTQKDK